MGSLDSMIRIIVAAGIGLLYFSGIINGTWAIVLGVLAVVFVLTSLVRVCPLYLPFGISTRRQPQQNAQQPTTR